MLISTKCQLVRAGIHVDLYDILDECCGDLDLTSIDKQAIIAEMLYGLTRVIIVKVSDFYSDTYVSMPKYLAVRIPLAGDSYDIIDAAEYVRAMAKTYLYVTHIIGACRGMSRDRFIYMRSLFAKVANNIDPSKQYPLLS